MLLSLYLDVVVTTVVVVIDAVVTTDVVFLDAVVVVVVVIVEEGIVVVVVVVVAVSVCGRVADFPELKIITHMCSNPCVEEASGRFPVKISGYIENFVLC
jgi:hypothetical protein